MRRNLGAAKLDRSVIRQRLKIRPCVLCGWELSEVLSRRRSKKGNRHSYLALARPGLLTRICGLSGLRVRSTLR
jgi:hypothetical protein